MAKLQVEIEGKVTGLKSALSEANDSLLKVGTNVDALQAKFNSLSSGIIGSLQNRLSQLKINLENATDIKSIVKYNIRIQETQEEIERLKNLGLQAGNAVNNIVPPNAVNGVNRLTNSFGNANGVALEFNRIIQDAPFGMIGMGNNIQQLVGNWQAYVASARAAAAQTGTTVTTMQLLRAAMGAIISPINLLTLGISLATSAWTFYTMWSQKANKANKDLDESTSKLVVTLRDFNQLQIAGIMERANKVREESVKQLRSYDAALQSATVSAQNEVAELKRIYTASQDTGRSIAERTKLVKYLKSEYPDYLKKFSVEQVLAGKAATAYDKLTTSIQNMANAKVFGDVIAENTKKRYENSQALLKIETRISSIEAETAKNVKAGLEGGTRYSGQIRRVAEGNLAQLKSEKKDLEAQNDLLKLDNDKLEKEINKTLGNRTDILKGVAKIDAETAKQQAELEKRIQQIRNEGLDYYSRRISEITQKYAELTKGITGAVLAQARLNEQAEKTRVWTELFSDLSQAMKSQSVNATISTDAKVPNNIGEQMAKSAGDYFTRYFKNANAKGLTDKGDTDLNKRLSRVVEAGFRQGLGNLFDDIDDLGSNFYEVFSNTFNKLSGSVIKTFQNLIATELGNSFSKLFEGKDGKGFQIAGLSEGVSKGVVAGLGVAGGLVSSMTGKTDTVGQIAGGALTGAAAGAILGPLGIAGGALLGGIAGFFGSKAAKKQQQIQEQQLAEQRKQTALLQYQNALSYASNIIGQKTVDGIVTAVDRNATGQLIATIAGKDIKVILDRNGGAR